MRMAMGHAKRIPSPVKECRRRTYLRVFRGVPKRYLSGYLALHELRVNLKAVGELFVAALVMVHYLSC